MFNLEYFDDIISNGKKLFNYHILSSLPISEIFGYFLAKTIKLLNKLLKGTLNYLDFYKKNFIYWAYKDLPYSKFKIKIDV